MRIQDAEPFGEDSYVLVGMLEVTALAIELNNKANWIDHRQLISVTQEQLPNSKRAFYEYLQESNLPSNDGHIKSKTLGENG